MSIDLNPVTPAIIPATPEKVFDLKWIIKLLLEGNPEVMRAYAELVPYRRIMGDVVVEITPAQPIMDTEGNPVVDAEGMPTYTPAVTETRTVVVGAELKSPLVDADVTRIPVDNILAFSQTDAPGEALVGAAIQSFLASGGSLGALTMACLTLMVRQIGIAQGKLTE